MACCLVVDGRRRCDFGYQPRFSVLLRHQRSTSASQHVGARFTFRVGLRTIDARAVSCSGKRNFP
jgi:hypothetical protein